MSINSRLKRSKGGNIFIPMNVEGGAWEENFLSSSKAIVIALLLLGNLILLGIGSSMGLAPLGWIVYVALMLFVDQLIIRYIVFEEKYFHRMYLKMKDNEVTTPGMFWSVPYIRNTNEGAVLVYANATVGAVVKLDRDTIVGRNEQFEEDHFEALSDFYKELNIRGLKRIQMNMMEKAGNDPRISKLNDVARKAQNDNVAKLLDMQLGFVKRITRETLYESDYILVYTSEPRRNESILDDVVDCVYKALDGAFTGYHILDKKELIDFCKEIYNVKYLDYMDATLRTVQVDGNKIGMPAEIIGIHKDDGSVLEVDNSANIRLLKLASVNLGDDVKIDEEALYNTIYRIQSKSDNLESVEKNLGYVEGNYEKIEENTSYASVKNLDLEISGIDDEIKYDDTEEDRKLKKGLSFGKKITGNKKEKKSGKLLGKKRDSSKNKNQLKRDSKVGDISKVIDEDEIIDF